MSEAKRSSYIVSPLYDWAFFLLPPSIALWLGFMISGSAFSGEEIRFAGVKMTPAQLALGTLIHAHLVAVVFRSHANRDIFSLHPYRFIAVPLILWALIVASPWLAVTATVVATFWDVWHSGAQTFGFARIYDRNAGAPESTRRLDMWINQLLYAGPILAGATLVDHIHVFDNYESIGATLFTAVPTQVEGNQRYLAYAIISLGTLLVAWYIVAHIRLHRRGEPVSTLKIFIVSSTGICSVYAWGFNSWGEAFFIMNLFHGVQYLALVWAVEHKRMMKMMRVDGMRRGKTVCGGIFLGSVGAYGFGAQILDPELTSLWAITMVVSLMHFWYDGFVWSVRKQQV